VNHRKREKFLQGKGLFYSKIQCPEKLCLQVDASRYQVTGPRYSQNRTAK